MLYQSNRFTEKVPIAINLQILLALGGGILSAVQSLLIVFEGDILCLNEGCEIVERLTTVPPLVFNVAGSLFFLTVFLALWLGARGGSGWLAFARLLLLAGIAAEGVLVGFQYYVAQVFCSYCLIIFGIIAALNILMGLRQLLAALAAFVAVLLAFSSLHFTPYAASEHELLENGIYGRLEKTHSDQELFLFFSSSCPHCEEVIATIDSTFTCSLNFNPIDTLQTPPVADLVLSASYSSARNRSFLKNLGLSEIPVLAVRADGEIRIIKGKLRIEDYLNEFCRKEGVSGNETSDFSGMSTQRPAVPFLSPLSQEEACSVETDCEDPPVTPEATQQ